MKHAANASVVFVRIDTKLKEDAEQILPHLGISASSAVRMLYSNIVCTKGIPFDLNLPDAKPAASGGGSCGQL